MSFCPVSAGLFFAGLIPLTLKEGSRFLLPAVYGVGTALPVLVFAFLIGITFPDGGSSWTKAITGEQLERLRDFGEVRMAWGLWRMLERGKLLDREIQPRRENGPWSTVAALLAIARFHEPSSEFHIEEKWYRRTAREELISVGPEQRNWRCTRSSLRDWK